MIQALQESQGMRQLSNPFSVHTEPIMFNSDKEFSLKLDETALKVATLQQQVNAQLINFKVTLDDEIHRVIARESSQLLIKGNVSQETSGSTLKLIAEIYESIKVGNEKLKNEIETEVLTHIALINGNSGKVT